MKKDSELKVAEHTSRFQRFPLWLLSESELRSHESFAKRFHVEAACYLFEYNTPAEAAEELLAQLGEVYDYFDLSGDQPLARRRDLTIAWVDMIQETCMELIKVTAGKQSKQFLRAVRAAAIAELRANFKLSKTKA